MKKPELKIKFVGKREAAPEFLSDGNLKITLPKDQSKPFAHVDAKRILRAFPELYKPVNEKGFVKRKVVRSSATGKFVTKTEAKIHPDTTQTETV